MNRITVIDNFISEEDANILISEQLNPSETNQYPEYYKSRYGGTAFPYNNIVMSILKKYGYLSSAKHKDLNSFINPIYVFKAFGSCWLPGTKGELHIDAQGPEPWIEFSTIIYLNDEFHGGELYFPNQNLVYKPKKYSAVFFPSAGSEYIHGVTTVSSGIRHTALYMHTSLPNNADPDFHPNKENWKALEHSHVGL
jgi:hypothetical protein